MRSAAVLFGGLLIVTGTLLAQSAPSFEAASVKPNVSGGLDAGWQSPPEGGRVVIRNLPLRTIISWAYQLGIDDDRLIGLPAWTRTEKFDIVAKAPEGVQVGGLLRIGPAAPGLLMMRTLLAERFQLKIHTETRELPIYALKTANADGRLGTKLVPSEIDCDRFNAEIRAGRAVSPPPTTPGVVAPCRMWNFRNRIAYGSQPLAALTDYLSVSVRRVVVDRTGLTGRFDFELIWTPDQLPPADSPNRIVVGGVEIDLTGGVNVDPNGAALVTALREQLGLKLESTRGPVEVFVIDRVERPTPD
jgi:uncharacterized protein (TIGR03435 family)